MDIETIKDRHDTDGFMMYMCKVDISTLKKKEVLKLYNKMYMHAVPSNTTKEELVERLTYMFHDLLRVLSMQNRELPTIEWK